MIAAPATAQYERGSWRARHSDQPSATEYWDLSARLASGHFVFARFFITNEGPGVHTAAGIGTLVHPDGRILPFRFGRREGDWTLSEDGLLIDIASLTLDMRRQPRRFELDSDKRGIKIHLDFESPGPPVWFDSGKSTQPVHHLDVLELAAPISGSIWVTGMSEVVKTQGQVTVTHAWMDTTESDLVARQVEVIFVAGETALYATEIAAPTGQASSWIAARQRGDATVTADAAESAFGEAIGTRRDYPLPGRIEIGNSQLRIEAVPKRELLRLDPIEVVPQPFRFLLSLKMKPQRITADASCRLSRAGSVVEADKPCLVSVTYLNPPQ